MLGILAVVLRAVIRAASKSEPNQLYELHAVLVLHGAVEGGAVSPHDSIPTEWRRRIIANLVLSLLGAAIIFVVVARFVAPVALEASGPYAGGFRIADFMLETELVRAYWAGEISSPYHPVDQAKVLAGLGSSGGVAAAFAMNPATLVLLAPFAAMAEVSFTAAYATFVALSFGVFLLLLLAVYSRLPREGIGPRTFWVAAVALVVASRVGWRSFALADTAPLAVAGLLLVYLVTMDLDGSKERWVRLSLLGVAYLLTLWKVHYIGVVAASHFLLGPRKEALLYGAGALAVAVGVPTLLDPQLMVDFFDQVSHYTGRGFSDQLTRIGQTSEGGSGVTLRSTLDAFMGNEAARNLGLVLLFGAGASILIMDLRQDESLQKSKRNVGREFDRPESAMHGLLLLSAFLVLMPYLGRYDDLFFVASISLVCLSRRELVSVWIAVGSCLALVVATQLSAPGGGQPAHLILVTKAFALAAFVVLIARENATLIGSASSQ